MNVDDLYKIHKIVNRSHIKHSRTIAGEVLEKIPAAAAYPRDAVLKLLFRIEASVRYGLFEYLTK